MQFNRLMKGASVARLTGTAALLGLMILSFQNCGKNPGLATASTDYIELASRDTNVSGAGTTDTGSSPETAGGTVTPATENLLRADVLKIQEAITPSTGSSPSAGAYECALGIKVPGELIIPLRSVADQKTCQSQCAVIRQVLAINNEISCIGEGQPIPLPPILPPVAPQPPTLPPVMPRPAPTELHVIGLYESSQNHQVSGATRVHVTGKGSATLLLSSYEETAWTIEVDPGVELRQVLVNGYDAQTVSGVDPRIVINKSYQMNGAGLLQPFSVAYKFQPQDAAYEAELARLMIKTDIDCTKLLGSPSQFPPDLRAMSAYEKCSEYLRNRQFVTAVQTLTGLGLRSMQGDYTAVPQYTVRVGDGIVPMPPIDPPVIPPPKPIAGECIAQDTVRGGATYPGVSREKCDLICKEFLLSAKPAAKVYDCRYLIDQQDIVVLKGRGPITTPTPIPEPPAPTGTCVAQDSVRGGMKTPGVRMDRCAAICKEFFISAKPTAKVYDCRFITGQKEVVVYQGRGPISDPPLKKVCQPQVLTLKFASNQGYGLEEYSCSGPMPEAKAGTKAVWGVPEDRNNMTGGDCKVGNIVGAHAHTVKSAKMGVCKHYCTLIADCDTNGKWVNLKYTW